MHIPRSHMDLMDGNSCAVLTTLMPDGQPQTTPVWCDYEGDYVMVNTMRGFRKEKNMRHNPKVNLFVYDPKNPEHNLEIRGLVIEMCEEHAREHLDRLTQLYMHKPGARFFGDSVAAELGERYCPVRVKIAPCRVRVEG